MARSLKISFPLPRRSSSSPHTTPASQYSNQSNIDHSPLSHPGTKAEKVLGISEVDVSELKKKQSKRGKMRLRKYPSFMSVTLSEVDRESVKTLDEFPFPGMQTPTELVTQPTQNKGRQGSSPLLGEQPALRSAIGTIPSKGYRPQACRAESSSTLRSHYDPKKSPLSISQQTSASSARDMALRKGFPPLSSPLSFDAADAVTLTKSSGLHSRDMSTDTKASGSSKLSGNSIKRINSIPRRRPSAMDPPTLFPNVNRAFHAVSPPPALINAALPKPLGTHSERKSSFRRPRWWAKVVTEQPSPIAIEDQRHHEDCDENFASVKINVKKPKASLEASMRNWFDGLGDEGTESDGQQGIEDSEYGFLNCPTQEPYTSSPSTQKIMTQGAQSWQIPERNRSLSNNREPATFSNNKSNFQLGSPPVPSFTSKSSSQAPENTSISESTRGSLDTSITQARKSSKGPHSRTDLQMVSFLELSSSEDEAESYTEPPYRRHRIRASIEKASYNNEVSVGSAQRAQPARPRSIANGRARAPSRRSNGSEKVPPVPKIPDKPRVSQRTSSVRWREIMEDRGGNIESTVESWGGSLSGSIDGRRATVRAKQTIRRSRFMKVTSEEEKLLQAMREKRASIRQDDFDKGFKTALQLQDIVTRPKTAGADGRISQSSNFRSRSSASPPPQEFAGRTSGTSRRFSASAEDIRFEDAYPFPKVPVDSHGYISPPKPSPSLSFSPSDILPGTPASHNSPITPPPVHGGLGAYGRSLTLSPPRGITSMNKVNHERKRTVSNHVVDIDGAEQQSQMIGEDDSSRWTLERW